MLSEGVVRLTAQPDGLTPACLLTLNQTLSGSALLSITQAGRQVGCPNQTPNCTPLAVEIASGPLDEAQSFWVAPSGLQIEAGNSLSLEIVAQDVYGNPVRVSDIQMRHWRPEAESVLATVTEVSRKPSCHEAFRRTACV